MPTTIDSENAKQIRQPMDVLIKMTVPEDIAITASGYASSAKVADGVLDERSWPMRKLADLQGDGFPLDGTCVLYDPSTTASWTNGKIGIRSNVGQPVSVTITGSSRINMMTVYADAATVSYSGGSASIVAGVAVIPVGATSTTLTFTPTSSTIRAEVSAIKPGGIFEITNDLLVSATVSLRSDLSLVDQTLPESELNVEVYNDADISNAVATIPRDTPVTYSAGYPGDMSPTRKFYLADQITWADNVLSIHAVDAVHRLDSTTFLVPFASPKTKYNLRRLVEYILDESGVDFSWTDWHLYDGWAAESGTWLLREGANARDVLAFLNQTLNLTDENGRLIDGTDTLSEELAFAYVDSGIPSVRSKRLYTTNYEIEEEDCADVRKRIDLPIGETTAEYMKITPPNWNAPQEVGTATLLRDIGTSLSFDNYAVRWVIGLPLGDNIDNEVAVKMRNKYGFVDDRMRTLPVVPAARSGDRDGLAPHPTDGHIDFPAMGSVPQEVYNAVRSDTFSTFVPWSQRYDRWEYESGSQTITTAARMWAVLSNAGIMPATSESLDLTIVGVSYNTEAQIKTYNHGQGPQYVYDELMFMGNFVARKEGGGEIEIYPSKMLAAPMYRSNVTGSFTWKGDPRIQPRDYFTFRRLDGTEEECTFENITIHHEGGGTYAEVTYRKGRI